VVERAAILSDDRITIAELPEDPHSSPFEDEPEAHVPSPAPAAPLPASAQRRPTLREHREASERRDGFCFRRANGRALPDASWL
jgi:hypothetical protein